MGSLTPDSILSTNPNDNNEKTMPSFSYETSFTSEFSSSSSTESRISRATSVSSELDELLYQSFNMSDKDKMRLYRILLPTKNFGFRKLLSEVQGAGGFSNRNIPCILLVETLLQLPGSQLLPWLFQVCVCHQDKLKCKVSD